MFAFIQCKSLLKAHAETVDFCLPFEFQIGLFTPFAVQEIRGFVYQGRT